MPEASQAPQTGRALVWSTATYVGTSLLNAALPFLLLPALTRWLSPADYGRLAMFQLAVNITLLFVGSSVDGAVGRVYFERDPASLRPFLGNVLLILCGSTLVLGLTLMVTGEWLAAWIELPLGALWCVLVLAAGRFLATVALTLWQASGHAGRFALFQIGVSVCTLAGTLALVGWTGLGWWGSVLAQTSVAVGFAVLAYASVAARFRPTYRFSATEASIALRFGLPLIPHSLGGLAIGMTDRLAISNLVGLSATGAYVVGAQIGMAVTLVQSAFNTAWTPWLFSRMQQGDPQQGPMIVRAVYLSFVCILAFAVALALAVPWIVRTFVGPEFQNAASYVPYLALGYAANGMYKVVAAIVLFTKRTELLALVTVATGLVNVFLTFLCVQAWGAVGAACAVLLSFTFLFLLTWRLAAALVPLPWALWRAGRAA